MLVFLTKKQFSNPNHREEEKVVQSINQRARPLTSPKPKQTHFSLCRCLISHTTNFKQTHAAHNFRRWRRGSRLTNNTQTPHSKKNTSRLSVSHWRQRKYFFPSKKSPRKNVCLPRRHGARSRSRSRLLIMISLSFYLPFPSARTESYAKSAGTQPPSIGSGTALKIVLKRELGIGAAVGERAGPVATDERRMLAHFWAF